MSFCLSYCRGSISQAFDTLPLLIKQETQSYMCALDLLLALYHDKENIVNQGMVEQRILSLLSDGLVYFLQTTLKSQRDAWCDLLTSVFQQVLNFPDSRYFILEVQD